MTHMPIQDVVRFQGLTPSLREFFDSYWQLSKTTLDSCMSFLADTSPQVLKDAGMEVSWQQFQQSSGPTREFILTQPEISRWINQLDRLVTLTPLSSQELRAHLGTIGRFATAALVRDRREGRTLLPFDDTGICALPGCGVVIQGGADFANRVTYCTVTSHGIEIASPDEDSLLSGAFEQLAGSMTLPTWLRRSVLCRGINVYNEDPLLWETGGGNFVYEDMEDTSQGKWLGILESSLAFVNDALPNAYDEIVSTIRVIIPVVPPVENSHTSGTNALLPGAIYLSYSDDPYIMAECLVHEYGHNKLNMLLKTDPLVTNALTGPRAYSPWKTEPRPLLGLLHGIFAFQGVCQLWQAALERSLPESPRRFILQRYYQFARQLKIALGELQQTALLTPAGASFLREVEAVVNAFNVSVPQVPAEIREAVDRQVAAHEREYRVIER